MRELKFRGWNGKRMTRVYTLNEMMVEQLEFNGLKENWMQYTGLKDKNGVEIYEGDVVKYHHDTYVIEYNYSGFKIEIKSVFYDFPTDYRNIEVIGNIYENPELLTDK